MSNVNVKSSQLRISLKVSEAVSLNQAPPNVKMQSSSPLLARSAEEGASLKTSASTFSIVAKSSIPLHSWIALHDEIRERKSTWTVEEPIASGTGSRKSIHVQTDFNPKDILFKQRECIKTLRKENTKLHSLLVAYRKSERKVDVELKENKIARSNGVEPTVESLDAMLDDLSDFTYQKGIKPVYDNVIVPSEKLMRQAVETVKDTIVDMLDELPKELAQTDPQQDENCADTMQTSTTPTRSPLRVVELGKSSKRRPILSRIRTKKARQKYATGSGLLVAPKLSGSRR